MNISMMYFAARFETQEDTGKHLSELQNRAEKEIRSSGVAGRLMVGVVLMVMEMMIMMTLMKSLVMTLMLTVRLILILTLILTLMLTLI